MVNYQSAAPQQEVQEVRILRKGLRLEIHDSPDFGWGNCEAWRPPRRRHSNVRLLHSKYPNNVWQTCKLQLHLLRHGDGRHDESEEGNLHVHRSLWDGTVWLSDSGHILCWWAQRTSRSEIAQVWKFCKFSPPLDYQKVESGQGSLIKISNKIAALCCSGKAELPQRGLP